MNHEANGALPELAAWRADLAATAVSDMFQRLRALQEESLQRQADAALTATSRALEAAGRALCAHDAAQAVAAQSALALALAEFVSAPVMACLDAVPRMQAVCMDALTSGARSTPPPPGERAAASPRTAATAGRT